MGLIIKNKIAQLKKGYPTVSDKYNVQGGIYEDTEALHFGDLLAYGSATGHYKKLTTSDTVKLAGICLATNVKLANRYPGDSNASVETVKGEAFNLLVRGFIAVAVKDATTAYKTALEMPEEKEEQKVAKKKAIDAAIALAGHEGDQVHLVEGEFATTGGTVVPGAYFTGVTEVVNGEVLAEINYRM